MILTYDSCSIFLLNRLTRGRKVKKNFLIFYLIITNGYFLVISTKDLNTDRILLQVPKCVIYLLLFALWRNLLYIKASS